MEDTQAPSPEEQLLHQERFKQEVSRLERLKNGIAPLPRTMYISGSPRPGYLGSFYDELPLLEADDLGFAGPPPAFFEAYESACRNGPLSIIRATLNAQKRTPRFLHLGFVLALRAGNVENARFLLSAGAPTARRTAYEILSAPLDKQVPLFQALADRGWTPETETKGTVMLPDVVKNLPVLKWLLDHGANPDIGEKRIGGLLSRRKYETNYCAALEWAASLGNVEAARILLDAGSKIESGVPLHCAAGVRQSSETHEAIEVMAAEFDRSMIPVMALLVERGADVNRMHESPYPIPCYALGRALNVGAVERVRWLFEHGANPKARWRGGTAISGRKWASEEMKRVVDEGIAAGRWLGHATSNLERTEADS